MECWCHCAHATRTVRRCACTARPTRRTQVTSTLPCSAVIAHQQSTSQQSLGGVLFQSAPIVDLTQCGCRFSREHGGTRCVLAHGVPSASRSRCAARARDRQPRSMAKQACNESISTHATRQRAAVVAARRTVLASQMRSRGDRRCHSGPKWCSTRRLCSSRSELPTTGNGIGPGMPSTPTRTTLPTPSNTLMR